MIAMWNRIRLRRLATSAGHGTVEIAADGSFVYRPGADSPGGDQFEYRASHGRSESTPATVTLIVTPAARCHGGARRRLCRGPGTDTGRRLAASGSHGTGVRNAGVVGG